MKRLLLLLLFAPFLSFSQKIENLKAAAEGEKIIITYDIVGGVPGDSYNISLFASSNKFASPLNLVSGDVGRGVSPGVGKRIEWESKAELRNFKGELSFEIQIEVVAAFKLQTETTSFRRGKTQTIMWRGGEPNQPVKVELLKAGVLESSLGSVANHGNFDWGIPSNQKTGSDYQLRLTSGSETITSGYLSIKTKIPLLIKVVPVVVVGAVAVLVLGGGGGAKDPTVNTSDDELATPPNILD